MLTGTEHYFRPVGRLRISHIERGRRSISHQSAGPHQSAYNIFSSDGQQGGIGEAISGVVGADWKVGGVAGVGGSEGEGVVGVGGQRRGEGNGGSGGGGSVGAYLVGVVEGAGRAGGELGGEADGEGVGGDGGGGEDRQGKGLLGVDLGVGGGEGDDDIGGGGRDESKEEEAGQEHVIMVAKI